MFRRSISRFVQSNTRNGISRSFSSFNNKIDLPISNEDNELPADFHDFYESYNQTKFARLCGYFEALRSKKEFYDVASAMKWQLVYKSFNRRMKTCGDKSTEKDNNVLPEVLPFPVSGLGLDDLIRLNVYQNISAPKNVDQMGLSKNVDLIIDIMRDLVHKIGKYHLSGSILLNLKPENIIIAEEKCRIERYDGEDCDAWRAPEQLLDKRQTKASNMFTFGCILYYCITGGHHPFGDTLDQRVHNIMANKMDISRVKDDAYDLISLLLRSEPAFRPKANEALSHPFFWDLKTKVVFIGDIISLVHREHILTDEVESKVPLFMDPDWCKKFEDYYNVLLLRVFEKPSTKDIPEDVFGPRGSPTFLPSVLMRAYEVAIQIIKDSDNKEEDWQLCNDFPDIRFKCIDEIGYRRADWSCLKR